MDPNRPTLEVFVRLMVRSVTDCPWPLSVPVKGVSELPIGAQPCVLQMSEAFVPAVAAAAMSPFST